jgi:3-isopropylmalate dehydrogenase
MVEKAIARVLDKGLRTSDILQPGMRKVSTRDMGSAILAELETLAA